MSKIKVGTRDDLIILFLEGVKDGEREVSVETGLDWRGALWLGRALFMQGMITHFLSGGGRDEFDEYNQRLDYLSQRMIDELPGGDEEE